MTGGREAVLGHVRAALGPTVEVPEVPAPMSRRAPGVPAATR